MKRIAFGLLSGAVGAVCGSLGVSEWWPAWLLLAAWLTSLIAIAYVTPTWFIRLMRERTDAGDA